jgi:hypothetical protein
MFAFEPSKRFFSLPSLSQAIQIALAIGGAIENSLSKFPFLRIVDWKR